MASRTYRGIRIVFFLLLVIACLLVSQAAPQSSTKRTGNSSEKRDSERYKKLSELLKNQKYINKDLKKLETSAKCPFEVLNYKGFTRVMCNFSKCDRNNSCTDCIQVYMKAADIIPKRGCKKKQGTPADVEMGCIYVPKQKNHSIETAVPGTEQ